MNQDIDTIYKASSPVLGNKFKKQQIAAEKKLKENVTSKPFNIGGLKNAQNVRNDIQPKHNS